MFYQNMRKYLWKIPVGVMTAVTVCAILWLTLAPKPLPDSDVRLFEGADKLVHACMFGGLYFVLSLDRRLFHGRGAMPRGKFVPALLALVCIVFGGAIELIQGAMEMGRGCDVWDFVADTAGVLLAVAVTPAVLRRIAGQ